MANNLVVTLNLDLAPYRAGLQAMVAGARAAAEQAQAQMAAGLAGVALPALDASGLERILQEATADLEALRARAQVPIEIPAPAPVVIPPPVLPPAPKLPPPDTSDWPSVRAAVQAMIEQPFERLTVTLAEVRQAKAQLDAQLMSATTGAARAEVAGLTAQLDALEAQMRATATAQAGQTAGAGSAQQILFGLVQTTQDVTAANGDWGLAMRYSANNLVQLSQMAGLLATQAAAAGTTMRATLLASLAGPTGLIVAGGALVSLLPSVVSWLGRTGDAQRQAAASTREHSSEVQQLIGDLKRLSGARAYAVVEQLRTEADLAGGELRSLDGQIAQVQARIERMKTAGQFDRATGNAGQTRVLTSEGRAALAELNRLEGERTKTLRNQLAASAAIERTETRNRSNLGYRVAALTAERDAMAEAGQDATALTAELRALEGQLDRLRGTGDFDPERMARAQAALARARDAAERKDTRTAERAADEARRLAGVQIQMGEIVAEARRETRAQDLLHEVEVAEARLEIVTSGARAEAEQITSAFARRMRLAEIEAATSAVALQLARERAELQRQAATDSANAQYQVAASHARATISSGRELNARLSAAAATRDAALEDAARSHQLALLQIARAGVQARLQMEAEARGAFEERMRADAERLTQQVQGYGEAARRASESHAAEAQRIQERTAARARALQQELQSAFSSFLSGATAAPQYSDDEAQRRRERFAAEERDIRASLRRREGDRAEHERRLRELRTERDAFERQVELDNRSAVVRGAEAMYESLRARAQEWLVEVAARAARELVFHEATENGKTVVTLSGTALRIAAGAKEAAADLAAAGASMVRAAAAWIADAVKKLGMFSLAAIPVGVAGLYGAYQGAKSLFGFRQGGYTGDGRDDEIAGPVHRGEVVLEAPIVRGQLGDVLALRKLLQAGVSAADLVAMAGLPGGDPSAMAVATPYAAPAAAPAVDLAPLLAEQRATRQLLDRQAAEITRLARPRVVDDRTARRLARAAQREATARGAARP